MNKTNGNEQALNTHEFFGVNKIQSITAYQSYGAYGYG
jgi:hypothetical protein